MKQRRMTHIGYVPGIVPLRSVWKRETCVKSPYILMPKVDMFPVPSSALFRLGTKPSPAKSQNRPNLFLFYWLTLHPSLIRHTFLRHIHGQERKGVWNTFYFIVYGSSSRLPIYYILRFKILGATIPTPSKVNVGAGTLWVKMDLTDHRLSELWYEP